MIRYSAFVFAALFVASLSAAEVPRTVTRIDDGWKADGEPVTLPHTWNATDGEDGAAESFRQFVISTSKRGGFYAQYWKWNWNPAANEAAYDRRLVVYERALPDPDPARRYFFKCDGAAITAEVYVNDVLVGRHLGSYTAFCYEITKYLKAKDNRIGVVVDNRPNRDIPVLSADYTVFGGIYRDCWLIATDAVCIDPTYYGGPGVAVAADPATGKVNVDVKTLGGAAEVSCAVDGRAVGGTAFTMKDFELWSPEHPKIYELTVKLAGGDAVTVPFGFRSTGFGASGEFLLNGKARKLRGVNRHQDRTGKGWCVTVDDETEDVALIKEMGCDAVRTAHYCQSQHIYDLLDRTGIVAWVELPLTDTLTPSVAFQANVEQMVREYVAQYGNHPSVCLWSVFNELQNGWSPNLHEDEVVKSVARANALFHELDATRPTVAATCRFDACPVNAVPDALAINTYPGWYRDTTPDITNDVAVSCRDNRRLRLGISEYGSGASVNCHAWPLPERIEAGGRIHPEEYQAQHHAEQYGYIAEDENVWGSFVWVMFDFAADTREEGEANGINDKGLVTRDRKTRKDAFYFYQANWTDTPVLRIVGTRMTEVASDKVPVVVFSNRGEVMLKVNGKAVGTKTPDRYKVVRWDDVALEKGVNLIEAVAAGHVAKVEWRVK